MLISSKNLSQQAGVRVVTHSVQLSFHHLEMKCDGQEFVAPVLLFIIFFPLTPSSRLWRQCALLLLPPTLRATLRHWQDSIYYKYSTHCLNHPLFLQERRTGSSPWPQKTMTYTTPSPPLHSTALPLLWAWAFTQKLILPREAFLNLEKRGCSLEFEPKWT